MVLLALVCGCEPSNGPVRPVQTGGPETKQNPATTAPAEVLKSDLEPILDLIKQRRTGPARVRLVKHLKLNPNDGQAEFLFGLTYHREQKYGEAVSHFQKALELAPNYNLIKYFHGWALYYLGEQTASRQAFETFLAQSPDHPDTLFALGLIDLEEDKLDDAQKHFERSIELISRQGAAADPRDISKAHARLADVLERRGQLAEARTHLERSIELYPDQYEAIYKLYRVLIRMGQAEEAQRVHARYLEVKERVRPGTSFPE